MAGLLLACVLTDGGLAAFESCLSSTLLLPQNSPRPLLSLRDARADAGMHAGIRCWDWHAVALNMTLVVSDRWHVAS